MKHVEYALEANKNAVCWLRCTIQSSLGFVHSAFQNGLYFTSTSHQTSPAPKQQLHSTVIWLPQFMPCVHFLGISEGGGGAWQTAAAQRRRQHTATCR